jgi:hypothetical protein
MTLFLWESRAPGEERAQCYSPSFYNSLAIKPSPAATASDPPASGLVVLHIFFDPHELVSWVNKVRKLDREAPPAFRFQLVLAA